MSGPVIKIKHPESLYIWRKRQDMTQVDAAEEFGVSPDKYREWESGQGDDLPWKNVGQLNDYEVYTLLRRRKGMTQKELAEKIGCTRLWIVRMETGKEKTKLLKNFWGV